MKIFAKKPKNNMNSGKKIKSVMDYLWLALDVGTENFKARLIPSGLTYDEPTYIAEDYEKNKLHYGEDAKNLIDKTNENVVIKRPVRQGNIADPEALERILTKIFNDFRLNLKERKKELIVLMATPSEINAVQREALENIVGTLGAKRGIVQEEVKMAALGSGQDIFGTAILCIDIGGGSTDIAVLSNDSILFSYTTNCAGDELTRQIQEYIEKAHGLRIGTKEAEDVKKTIGSLLPYQDEKPYTITGVSVPRATTQAGETMSISKTIEITPEDIRENVMKIQFKARIIAGIREVLRTAGAKAPGSISDLKKKGKGITICGGGAYIKKIDEFIATELAKEYHIEISPSKGAKPIRQKYEGDTFEVRVAIDPLNNVIDGLVKYIDTVYKMLIDEEDPNREILQKEEDIA